MGFAVAIVRSGAATRQDLGLTFAGFRSDSVWTMKVIGALLAGSVVLMAAAVLVIRLAGLRVDIPDEMTLWPVSLLCAPLAEEFVYRTLLVPGLRAGYGPRGVVLFSALLFYALHLGYRAPWWTFHYLLAGAILSWVFVQRPRLWICVLLHAGGNLLVMADDILRRVKPGALESLLGQGR
jgi:membrane protease YdiL (CAAX protease family)